MVPISLYLLFGVALGFLSQTSTEGALPYFIFHWALEILLELSYSGCFSSSRAGAGAVFVDGFRGLAFLLHMHRNAPLPSRQLTSGRRKDFQ